MHERKFCNFAEKFIALKYELDILIKNKAMKVTLK